MTAGSEGGASYWFCLKHNKVEREDGCAAEFRIGPYATEGEAHRGLETIHNREKRKQAEDEAWEGDS